VLVIARVPVTPDPEAAAALERKLAELRYYPVDGFHRDRIQPRLSDSTPALLRRQAG
jgi:hypothetical protein